MTCHVRKIWLIGHRLEWSDTHVRSDLRAYSGCKSLNTQDIRVGTFTILVTCTIASRVRRVRVSGYGSRLLKLEAYSQCCRKPRSALCVQLRRLVSDAKPTQSLVTAEMKKLSQIQLSALCVTAPEELFSTLVSLHGFNSWRNGWKSRSSMRRSSRRSTWPRT